jgi:hypothetical protein
MEAKQQMIASAFSLRVVVFVGVHIGLLAAILALF